MPTSATTLLRAIRSVPLPNTEQPHVVGVDDWALRKGRTYGTIVVDLERRRPIDLLPDRSAETWAAWLRREPRIRLVARDRSTEYARGITLSAPTAVQVSTPLQTFPVLPVRPPGRRSRSSAAGRADGVVGSGGAGR